MARATERRCQRKVGKKSALAAPMLALQATSRSSAVLYRGRRSSSAEGKRQECLAESTVRSSAVPRGIGPGFTPEQQIDLALLDGIWRSGLGSSSQYASGRDAESSSSLLEAHP